MNVQEEFLEFLDAHPPVPHFCPKCGKQNLDLTTRIWSCETVLKPEERAGEEDDGERFEEMDEYKCMDCSRTFLF